MSRQAGLIICCFLTLANAEGIRLLTQKELKAPGAWSLPSYTLCTKFHFPELGDEGSERARIAVAMSIHSPLQQFQTSMNVKLQWQVHLICTFLIQDSHSMDRATLSGQTKKSVTHTYTHTYTYTHTHTVQNAAVSRDPVPSIHELSHPPQMRHLRTIALDVGMIPDPEGVAWVGGQELVVVCEETGNIARVNVGAATPPPENQGPPAMWSAPQVSRHANVLYNRVCKAIGEAVMDLWVLQDLIANLQGIKHKKNDFLEGVTFNFRLALGNCDFHCIEDQVPPGGTGEETKTNIACWPGRTRTRGKNVNQSTANHLVIS
eukprot:60543-Pelagomonas_calceolata.AAC.1